MNCVAELDEACSSFGADRLRGIDLRGVSFAASVTHHGGDAAAVTCQRREAAELAQDLRSRHRAVSREGHRQFVRRDGCRIPQLTTGDVRVYEDAPGCVSMRQDVSGCVRMCQGR